MSRQLNRKPPQPHAPKPPKSPHLAANLPDNPKDLYTHCSGSWTGLEPLTVAGAVFANIVPSPATIAVNLKAVGDALPLAEGGDAIPVANLHGAAGTLHATWALVTKFCEVALRNVPIEQVPAILTQIQILGCCRRGEQGMPAWAHRIMHSTTSRPAPLQSITVRASAVSPTFSPRVSTVTSLSELSMASVAGVAAPAVSAWGAAVGPWSQAAARRALAREIRESAATRWVRMGAARASGRPGWRGRYFTDGAAFRASRGPAVVSFRPAGANVRFWRNSASGKRWPGSGGWW